VPITPTLDLTAAELNLAIVGGDGLAVTFTLDIDLTGYSVDAAVVGRKSRDVVQAIDAQLVSAAPGGSVVTCALLGSETEPLSGLGLDWWLDLTPLGGQRRTILQGRFVVEEH
jgi:hypothetical protein